MYHRNSIRLENYVILCLSVTTTTYCYFFKDFYCSGLSTGEKKKSPWGMNCQIKTLEEKYSRVYLALLKIS